MLFSLLIFLGCGAVVGILAGLLGVGGGTVIVPMLLAVFPYDGVPAQYTQQLALGTSLASIMFTSVASSWAHHRRGCVNWDIFMRITPGILLGTFGGGLVATHLPVTFLKIFFICFLAAIACQMFFSYRPSAARHMPGFMGTAAAGGVIGLISSFAGIGGGAVSVPFMAFCGIDIHKAIGTSAAIGFPIAVAGSLGYIVGGWGRPDLPPMTLGFVHLWALLGIAGASWLTVPLGVRLSHALPTQKLKQAFAVFLFIIALKMTWDLV